MAKIYDIIIIGAGSGGLTITSVAGQLGFKVALVEGHKMGGDCLNYGCIPSKAFLYASKKYGKFTETFKHIKQSIKTIEPHDSIERFESFGVDVIKGYARFISENIIKVDEEVYEAKKFVIATGSKPFIPKIKGLEKIEYLTNETVFNLKTKPESIVILGAGPIGIEMATCFNNLGVKTSIIQRSTGILKKDDSELTEMLKSKMAKDGIEFFENCVLQKVNRKGGLTDFEVICDDNKFVISAEQFLISSGRVPNTEVLDLDNASIDYNHKGFIEVDDKLQTSNNDVYAIGDVIGKGLFTHLASYQAGILIKRLLFGSIFAKTDYTALPWTTYSSPELAQIGLTEKQARKIHGMDIKVYSADFKENDRAVTENAKFGKIKLILDNRGKTLGVSILGKNAGEIIQQWTKVVQKRQKPSVLLDQIYIYPTLSDINRLVASKVYKDLLFSRKVRFLSKLLFKFVGVKLKR
ncbi:MAG: NAD(P)/FAD-dependent oxidoreductase [Proteobacteria bacterium]|nr:NAD(P)/FAD-dependent oxidoreductase [Pseudomonadota bacterium]